MHASKQTNEQTNKETHKHTRVHAYKHTHTHQVRVCVCVCVRIHMYACYACTYVCMYANVCMNACMCMCTHRRSVDRNRDVVDTSGKKSWHCMTGNWQDCKEWEGLGYTKVYVGWEGEDFGTWVLGSRATIHEKTKSLAAGCALAIARNCSARGSRKEMYLSRAYVS